MKKFLVLGLMTLAICGMSCNNNDVKPPETGNAPATPSLTYNISGSQPHDTSYFTEGLEFYNNTLLESTGLNGRSKLVQYDPATGKLLQQVILDPKYFGEGITVLHDTLYQLTYQEHVVHVYSVKDFRKIKELPLSGEGWGLTNDGKNLIASNGSSSIYYYEPSTFKLLKVVDVTDNDNVVMYINELEYINGFLYANIWKLNTIIKIDPNTGKVVARLDLTDLVRRTANVDEDHVLNGIAYNKATDKIYVTGKNWPVLYEVQFDH